jgi:hypothetical protein
LLRTACCNIQTATSHASNYQLGAVIVQEGVPVAYFSQKLTGTQKKYTTLEKALLSIFTVFKTSDTMLSGTEITIHIDHKNLTYTSTVNDHALHQLNYVKRSGPKYQHITRDDNFLANMFSQLERLAEKYSPPDTPLKRESTNNFSFLLDNNKLLECFLNLPNAVNLPFALDLERIAQGQQNNPALWQRRLAHSLQYPEQQCDNTCVLLFQPAPNAPWKICIPTQQLDEVTNWFHLALYHCGLIPSTSAFCHRMSLNEL